MTASPLPPAPQGVLFVCLGNICRSPLAKWLFTHHALRRGVLDQFLIDSCGTGPWHAGRGADARSVRTAQRYGLATPHTARQLDAAGDFDRFHLLLAMDRSNRANLLAAGADPSRVRLMRSFDPLLTSEPEHTLDVPDPYEGGEEGFENVYQMLDRACVGLLDHLLRGR